MRMTCIVQPLQTKLLACQALATWCVVDGALPPNGCALDYLLKDAFVLHESCFEILRVKLHTWMMGLPEPGFGNQGKGIALHSSLGKDVDQPRVATQMGQHPQLNLAVVSSDQHTPRTCHKSIPDVNFPLAEVLSDGNVCLCSQSILGDSLQPAGTCSQLGFAMRDSAPFVKKSCYSIICSYPISSDLMQA